MSRPDNESDSERMNFHPHSFTPPVRPYPIHHHLRMKRVKTSETDEIHFVSLYLFVAQISFKSLNNLKTYKITTNIGLATRRISSG